MIKRRFYKLEHGDKDSGSDSSCFSSDSDPETEESEEYEEDDSIAVVSEDENSGDDESPAVDDGTDVDDDDEDDYNSGGDEYGGRLGKMSMSFNADLEEPPEEQEEDYILGCMIKCKSVYKCRYCPTVVCLNENTMQAHVSSKKHARMEKLLKEGKLRNNDEEVDDPETPSQEKQSKRNRRSQRQGKRSQKPEKDLLTKRGENKEVDDPETSSQEKLIQGNIKARREQKRLQRRLQKQEKGSTTKHGEKEEVHDPEAPFQGKEIKENSRTRRQCRRAQMPQKTVSLKGGEDADASQKSRKKRRQNMDGNKCKSSNMIGHKDSSFLLGNQRINEET